MEVKGLWKHVEGKATPPKPYAKVNGIAILSDGKTQATEEQIEAHECRIDDFAKAASLAKHIILSMTSARIGMKIKTLTTAKEMWDEVKKDATAKSTLYLVDVEHQLESMRLSESSDPKTHLTKLKSHFQLMMLRHKNLLEMGSSFSKQKLIILHYQIHTNLLYKPSQQLIGQRNSNSQVSYWWWLPKPLPRPLLACLHMSSWTILLKKPNIVS